ncbi:hypothetical protein AVEN_248978-1 [Araneus ventricosus]|uniref:Uncharacterized protein n=1 Tax=Araneus ventricosus TaxID=182803 RepID=A0A4Y2VQ60_ARAVE|nr:hypothetical protein AVEN_248978-1 [Araneus ventricosus]
MDWPARSPDQLIEHVWDALGGQLQSATPSRTLQEMKNKQAWERVGPIATGYDKLPYFKEVTLQGLSLRGDHTPINTFLFILLQPLFHNQTTTSVTHDHACVLGKLLNGYLFCIVSMYVHIKFH